MKSLVAGTLGDKPGIKWVPAREEKDQKVVEAKSWQSPSQVREKQHEEAREHMWRNKETRYIMCGKMLSDSFRKMYIIITFY